MSQLGTAKAQGLAAGGFQKIAAAGGTPSPRCLAICRCSPVLYLLQAIILVTLPFCGGGCAGYMVGNGTLFRPDIETVYVPMFQSDSLRPGLGERLTEAVIKEIELRTPYKVVGSPEKADSILTGRIVSETKRTVVENPYDDPREIATRFQVEVQWIDNRGRQLTPEETLPVPPELTTVVAETTFVPEVGQSLATAQQAAIQRLAGQIVGMMENPW